MKARRLVSGRSWLAAALFMLAIALLPAAAHAQDPIPTGVCGDAVTIVEGDTLSGIAARCDTTVEALMAANPGINPLALQIGSTVFLTGAEVSVDLPARVAITTPEVAPGENIELIANGFPPSSQVTISLSRGLLEPDIETTAVTNEEGALQMQLLLPDDFAPTDEWTVTVAMPGSDITAATGGEQPVVAIWPTSGAPATEVQVLGNGFPANVEVTVSGGVWQTSYNVLGTALTDDSGTLNAVATLPAFATFGEEWVFVVAYDTAAADESVDLADPQDSAATEQPEVGVDVPAPEGGVVVEPTPEGVEATSGLFLVTELGAGTRPPAAAPTATPASADSAASPTFDRTTIFLVALEDAGVSGPAIGCGDSLVPVEIQVAPTTAPLTAALESLLALGTQTYGESGLYNALYQSSLSVDSVVIDAGTAVINLSGTLLLGGACDTPRVDAQLRQTALQVDAVSAVEIFVNGQPLESMLTQ